MSWFLFGNSKKKPSKRKPAKQPRSKTWDPALTYRALQGGLIALLLVAGGTGWALGLKPLKRSIAASHKTEPKVTLIEPPAWMPPELSEELRGLVADSLSPDPFDRVSLHAAAQRLAASPWVERVLRVSRQPGGGVEVRAEYRRRVALVRSGSSHHLIDTKSVRLPFSYTSLEAAATGLPILHGVSAPLPAAGKTWGGSDLAAGLKLAAYIAREDWATQVRAIEVSNHGGRVDPSRGHLKILTALDSDGDPTNNPGVEWGRAPGEEQPYEPDAAWKLQRIAREIRKFGPLTDRVVKVTQEPGLTSRLPGDEEFVNATERRELGNDQ